MSQKILPQKLSAMLFDMDGTILNSIAAAERVWARWASRHGLDVEAFLPTIHGVRSTETIAKLNLPGVDPEVEALKITNEEISEAEGIVEIPGAAEFLNSLPLNKWAVVTSAPLGLAHSRLKAAGLPVPSVLISAEDVEYGKPNPECYILAAQKLGVEISNCLVFEDAEAGILAAEAAGAHLVVVTSTHKAALVSPHLSIKDYTESRDALLGRIL